jgi:uncharacterized membrane protein YccC
MGNNQKDDEGKFISLSKYIQGAVSGFALLIIAPSLGEGITGEGTYIYWSVGCLGLWCLFLLSMQRMNKKDTKSK